MVLVGVVGGMGWGCPCIRSSPSVITRAGLTARLARHHQSLNYLTDVSLAAAADPVAERQRGAPERGAPRGGGGGKGRGGGSNTLHSHMLSGYNRSLHYGRLAPALVERHGGFRNELGCCWRRMEADGETQSHVFTKHHLYHPCKVCSLGVSVS